MRSSTQTLLIIASVAAGCGVSSEEDRVREVVERYVEAYAKGDAQTVCELTTEAVKRNYQEGCEPWFEGGYATFPESELERLNAVEVRAVEVDGRVARVRFESQSDPRATILRKLDGHWLLDGVGEA